MKAVLRAGAVLAAVLTVATGCGDRGRGPAPAEEGRAPVTVDPSSVSTSDAAATAPTTTVAAVDVRIGFLGDGAGVPSGTGALSRTVEDGERLAVSQFTSDHPGITVTIDAPPTSLPSLVAARRLVADRVVAVIGPITSTQVRATLPVLSAAGVPAVSPTATAPDVAESGWTSFFRAVADDRQQGVDAATELVGSLHVTTLAVLAGAGSQDQTRATWASSTATQLGVGVTQGPVITTATVSAAARLVVGSGVAGLYFSGPAALANTLVSDLSGDGYQGVVLIASDSASSVLGPLGPAADGVYLASPADDPTAAAAHGGAGLVFDDAYRAAFGTDPPPWAAEAYDATDMVLEAVASGATAGPAVAEYLFNHAWVGVSGELSFDSSGDLVDPPLFISRIVNGVASQVATITQPASP